MTTYYACVHVLVHAASPTAALTTLRATLGKDALLAAWAPMQWNDRPMVPEVVSIPGPHTRDIFGLIPRAVMIEEAPPLLAQLRKVMANDHRLLGLFDQDNLAARNNTTLAKIKHPGGAYKRERRP